MQIKQFSVVSPSLFFELSVNSPVCVLRGRRSALLLDLLRELLGDIGEEDPDGVDDGRFVLDAEMEIEGKDYSVCYLRNAETMGERRFAVNFRPDGLEFSVEDTRSFLELRNERLCNALTGEGELPDSQDGRPLFVYHYFDKLDHATELAPVLRRLASSGRQVFIAVCPGYPAEELMEGVQIADVEESIYSRVICPICGEETFDNHWICPVCKWEYDGTEEHRHSSANGSTPRAYREAFLAGKEGENV